MNPLFNQYAPPAYNGLSGSPGPVVDMDYTYLYTVALTANQMLRDQVVALEPDADFVWRALIATSYTGVYQVRFSDSQGYYMSNALLPVTLFLYGTLPVPFPVFPELVLPAGGRIGIDIQDLSGGGNTVEIAFRGVKRYRVAG